MQVLLLPEGDPLFGAPSALRPALPAVRPRAFEALSVPGYRIYAAALVLVSSGTWIQNITQDWLVLTLTHDAGAVGLTAAFQFLPALLLGPLGGRLADRQPGRRLLLRTQSLNVVLAGITATLALSGRARPWEIYLVAALAGLVWVVDNPPGRRSSATSSGRRHCGAPSPSTEPSSSPPDRGTGAGRASSSPVAGPGDGVLRRHRFFAASLLVWFAAADARTPSARRSSAARRTETSSDTFGADRAPRWPLFCRGRGDLSA
jgi:MFS family permease